MEIKLNFVLLPKKELDFEEEGCIFIHFGEHRHPGSIGMV